MKEENDKDEKEPEILLNFNKDSEKKYIKIGSKQHN